MATFSLSKPVHLAELGRVVSSVVSCKTWIETSKEDKHDNSSFLGKLGDLRILVVDDTAINRLLVMEILGDAGVVVATADDGREAVEKATASVFDAILMDIQMPDMDGYMASRTIRELSPVNLPIIAMTADASKENREKCLAAGMNDLIAKPVDQKSLFATLSKWIPLHRRGTLLSLPGKEPGHRFGQSSHKIQEHPESFEHPQSITKQDHQRRRLGTQNNSRYQGNLPDVSDGGPFPACMEERSFYRYNCKGECQANILFESGRKVDGILKDLSIVAGFFLRPFWVP